VVRKGEKPAPWLGKALDGVTSDVAVFWHERQSAPRSKALAATLARLHADIGALERLCEGSSTLEAVVLRTLFPDPMQSAMTAHWAATWSGGGQGDALARLGWPSPKLVTACAAIGLCRAVGDTPPHPKNPFAVAFCAPVLWRAREQADDPAPVPETRPTLWEGWLSRARRVYADEPLLSQERVNALDYAGFLAAKRNEPLLTARRLVDGIIERARQQTDSR
jgi:hypothetical protein